MKKKKTSRTKKTVIAYLGMKLAAGDKMEQSPDFCWGIIVKRKVQRVTEVVQKIVGPRVGERV